MKMTKTAATAALGLAALLLSACSGGADAPSNNGGTTDAEQVDGAVFDFPLNGAGPYEDGEVTIAIPDDLREALGSQADAILVDSVLVTPHEVDGLELCAADLAIAYADGGYDALAVESTSATSEPVFESAEEALSFAAQYEGDGEGMLAALADRGVNVASEGDSFINAFNEGELSSEELVEILLQYSVPVESAVSGEANLVHELLGTSRDRTFPIDDFDASSPERGTYVAADGSTITVVTECASSAFDEDAAFDFVFPQSGDGDHGPETGTFAEVEISVMTSGTIGVQGAVRDYVRDAEGGWVAS